MLKDRLPATVLALALRWATALVVGIVIAAPACAPTPSPRPAASPAPASPEAGSPDVTSAKVVRIVDGDTARMIVNGVEERVRFIGIDTPERGKPFFDEATRYTANAMDGSEVWLETDIDTRDRYGRLLAYVWLAPPQSSSPEEVRARMFNAKALLDGYALLATFPPNVRYVDLFTGFQTEAREQQRGLWASR